VTRTYIDANVVIAAARGDDALASRALTYLEDPQRTFVSSIFVRLEVLPKAAYLKRSDEAACYTTFVDSVRARAPVSNALLEHAPPPRRYLRALGARRHPRCGGDRAAR